MTKQSFGICRKTTHNTVNNVVKSFFYAVIKKFKTRQATPHLDPFRERRGENKKSPLRKNPDIVALVDEWLGEDGATAPKIRTDLLARGHTVSLATIHRIARDLCYKWQKPWYTDVLTPAQKMKRKLFCAQLLRLPEDQLLMKIADWMWTDEKWWDVVGPAMYKYVKATTKAEGKMGNQVGIKTCLHLFNFVHAKRANNYSCCRCRGTKVRRAV